jgi:hypothetical protein
MSLQAKRRRLRGPIRVFLGRTGTLWEIIVFSARMLQDIFPVYFLIRERLFFQPLILRSLAFSFDKFVPFELPRARQFNCKSRRPRIRRSSHPILTMMKCRPSVTPSVEPSLAPAEANLYPDIRNGSFSTNIGPLPSCPGALAAVRSSAQALHVAGRLLQRCSGACIQYGPPTDIFDSIAAVLTHPGQLANVPPWTDTFGPVSLPPDLRQTTQCSTNNRAAAFAADPRYLQ